MNTEPIMGTNPSICPICSKTLTFSYECQFFYCKTHYEFDHNKKTEKFSIGSYRIHNNYKGTSEILVLSQTEYKVYLLKTINTSDNPYPPVKNLEEIQNLLLML